MKLLSLIIIFHVFAFNGFSTCKTPDPEFDVGYMTMNVLSGTIMFNRLFTRPPTVIMALSGFNINPQETKVSWTVTNVSSFGFDFQIECTVSHFYYLDYNYMAFLADDMIQFTFWLGSSVSGNPFHVSIGVDGTYNATLDISSHAFTYPDAVAYIGGYYTMNTEIMGYKVHVTNVTKNTVYYQLIARDKASLRGVQITILVFEKSEDYTVMRYTPDAYLYSISGIDRRILATQSLYTSTPPQIFLGLNSFQSNVNHLRFMSIEMMILNSSNNSNTTFSFQTLTWHNTILYFIEISVLWIVKNSSINQNCYSSILKNPIHTDEPNPSLQSLNFYIDSCNCSSPYYFNYTSKMCETSCPLELVTVDNAGRTTSCQSPCQSGLYYYPNGSCLEFCFIPNSVTIVNGNLFCKFATLRDAEFDTGMRTQIDSSFNTITFSRTFSQIPKVVILLTGGDIQDLGMHKNYALVNSITKKSFTYALYSATNFLSLQFTWMAFLADDVQIDTFTLGDFASSSNWFADYMTSSPDGIYYGSLNISSYRFFNPNATICLGGYHFSNSNSGGKGVRLSIVSVNQTQVVYKVESYVKTTIKSISITIITYESSSDFYSTTVKYPSDAFTVQTSFEKIVGSQFNFPATRQPIFFFGLSSFKKNNGGYLRFNILKSSSFNFYQDNVDFSMSSGTWETGNIFDVDVLVFAIMKKSNINPNCTESGASSSQTLTSTDSTPKWDFFFSCVCSKSLFYYTKLNQCVPSCPFPIFKSANATFDNLCTYPCPESNYLYWNGSCLPSCQSPFVETIIFSDKYCYRSMNSSEFETGYREQYAGSSAFLFSRNFSKTPTVVAILSGYDLMSLGYMGIYLEVTSVSITGFSVQAHSLTDLFALDISWIAFNADDFGVNTFWLGDMTDSNSFAAYMSSSSDGIYSGSLDISSYHFSSPSASIFLSGFNFKIAPENTVRGVRLSITNINRTHVMYKVEAFEKITVKGILITIFIYETSSDFYSKTVIYPANAFSSILEHNKLVTLNHTFAANFQPIFFFGVNAFKVDGNENLRFQSIRKSNYTFVPGQVNLTITSRNWFVGNIYSVEIVIFAIMKKSNIVSNCSESSSFIFQSLESFSFSPSIVNVAYKCSCPYPLFNYSTTMRCVSYCPSPINWTLDKPFDNMCSYPCQANQYLYWNGSCLPSCQSPLVETIIFSTKFCYQFVSPINTSEFDSGYRYEPGTSGTISFSRNFSQIPKLVIILSGCDLTDSGEVRGYVIPNSISNTGFSYQVHLLNAVNGKDLAWMAYIADDIRHETFWIGNWSDPNGNAFADYMTSSPDGVYYGVLNITSYGFLNPNATIFLGGFYFSTSASSNDKGVSLSISSVNQSTVVYKITAFEKTTVKALLITIFVYESSSDFYSDIVQYSPNIFSTNPNTIKLAGTSQEFPSYKQPIFFFGFRSFKKTGTDHLRFATIMSFDYYFSPSKTYYNIISMNWDNGNIYNVEVVVFGIMKTSNKIFNCSSDHSSTQTIARPSAYNTVNDFAFSCTCKKPLFIYTTTNKCVSYCPSPINSTSNFTHDNLCTFPCQGNDYLYWNSSCLPTCPSPFIINVTFSDRFCNQNQSITTQNSTSSSNATITPNTSNITNSSNITNTSNFTTNSTNQTNTSIDPEIDYGCIRELNCSLTPNATFASINPKFGMFMIEFDLKMNNTIQDVMQYVDIKLTISSRDSYNISYFKLSERTYSFQIIPISEMPAQIISINITNPAVFKSFENIPTNSTYFELDFLKMIIVCPDNCVSCKTAVSCQTCEYNFLLKNGLCYKITYDPPDLSFTQNSQNPNVFYLTFSEAILIDRDLFGNITSLKFEISTQNYSYVILKSSDTVYSITLKNNEEIPSQLLTAYFANNTLLIGSKGLYYPKSQISLGIKSIPSLEVVKSITALSDSISDGSSYVAILSLNPMLLWMIITNLQPYYYILFYNIELPLNLKKIMSVFNIARLNFFPDIGLFAESHGHLTSPEKFSEQNIDGYFLKSGMSPIYTLISVYIAFCLLVLINDHIRRMPVFLRKIVIRLLKILNKPFFLNFWLGLYLDQTIMAALQLRLMTTNTNDDGLSVTIATIVYCFNIHLLYLVKKYGRARYDDDIDTFLKDIVIVYRKRHRFMFFGSLLVKFLIGNIIVWFYDFPTVQIWLSFSVYLAYCICCFLFSPTDDRIKNFLIIFNEALMGVVCVLLYAIHVLNLNNADSGLKFKVGWMILWLAVTHLTVIILMSLRLNKLVEKIFGIWLDFKAEKKRRRRIRAMKISLGVKNLYKKKK